MMHPLRRRTRLPGWRRCGSGQISSEASPIGEGTSQAEAADLLNVGKRSVERARVVIEKGEPTGATPGTLLRSGLDTYTVEA